MNNQNSFSENSGQKEVKTVKKLFTLSSAFKYKLAILVLSLILLSTLVGFGYIGFNGYQIIENQKNEIEKLKSERDTNLDELKVANEDLTAKLNECSRNNQLLETKVNDLSTKLEELRPKDIREFDFKKIKNINTELGDFWLNPLYIDVNGDGRLDGIFSYRQGGTGEFLNVYVYSYLNGNNLTEILRAERYLKGSFIYLADQGILEITSEAGTPDTPFQAKSRFKWDSAQNKMVLLKNQN